MSETHSPHDISRALNLDWLDVDLVNVLPEVWSRDTCWPGCASEYPENLADNPSFGNCLVTTLAAWAHHDYNDEIVAGLVHLPEGGAPIWHFRLRCHEETVDPVDIDATWQQFPEGAVFEELEEEHPRYDEVIQGSFFEDPSLPARLAKITCALESQGIAVHPAHQPGAILRQLGYMYRKRGGPDFTAAPCF